jgi:hypothetical protein
MLRLVALIRTDVSEERIASIIRVITIVELGTMLAVNSNRSTLRRNNMSQRVSVASYCNVVPSAPILITLTM